MYTMGLDIGSTASKGLIIENGKEIIASSIISLGTGTKGPKMVVNELFNELGITRNDISKLVVTGYGRVNYEDADKQISELSCHAKGVHFLEPDARTILDIGGQDAKAMSMDEKGILLDFVMNDKCAAGTGRFLDVMARILGVDVSELGDLSEESNNIVSISSTCTVFAESEVISHLSSDIPMVDIIAGVHDSVAKRVSSLAKRVGIKEGVVMVGGVARNKGIVKAMQKALSIDIIRPEYAQLTGALGAALYAFKEATK